MEIPVKTTENSSSHQDQFDDESFWNCLTIKSTKVVYNSQKSRKKFAALSLNKNTNVGENAAQKKEPTKRASVAENYPAKRPKTETNINKENQQSVDAFHVYSELQGDNLTQFFDSTQILKQIDDTIAKQTESFKKPLAIQTKQKLQDIFSDKTREEIEDFFNNVENTINLMGAQNEENVDKNAQTLDLLLKTQQAELPNSQLENLDASLASLNAVNASFGTALKNALVNNMTKLSPEKAALDRTVVSQPQAQFQELGPFYGLPVKVKELIQVNKGVEDLYNWQHEFLQLEAIKTRRNVIYALPTSGGKTLVAEILMMRELLCRKRNAIFILPFVAIVQEKVWSMSPFGVALDFLVEEYAASKGTYPPRKRRRKNSIYIATIEKALGLINSLTETGRMQEIGLVVVDELHLIGEKGRGATLEALLTKILLTKADVQIVGMSATIGNLQDLSQFLNSEIYFHNFRPVELTEYVKCEKEIARINWSKGEEELLTVVRSPDFEYSEAYNTIDPDKLTGLVMEIVPQGSCLIFCASKKNCENVAILLSRLAPKRLLEHKKEEKLQLKKALEDETGTLCTTLEKSIKYGFAYHHSGLTNEERRAIEDSFRAGVLTVICCTSTLAAGVNLPARRVILRQPYVGREFITLSKYKQMVGRAGRTGLGESGDSILICKPQDLEKVRKLLMEPMDKALSSMHECDGKALRHLLLSCISLGMANTRAQLQEVTKKTLLYIQKDLLEVDVKKMTDIALRDLFKLGALERAEANSESRELLGDVTVRLDSSLASTDVNVSLSEESRPRTNKVRVVLKNDTKLVISKLGTAAIKGNFELFRAHMLYDDLHQAQRSLVLLDSLHLLYLLTPYEIAEQIRPNKYDYYTIYSNLSPNALQTAKLLGMTEPVAVKFLSNQPITTVPERVINRFYATLILHDLWNAVPLFEVAETYQVDRGLVQNLMTSASSFASNVVSFCEELGEFWTFAQLFKGMIERLSHCCVRELMPLMELPAVKQSRAKQLFKAGYKSLQSIAKANPDDIVEAIQFMPRKVAKQLVSAAKMLLLEKVENYRDQIEELL